MSQPTLLFCKCFPPYQKLPCFKDKCLGSLPGKAGRDSPQYHTLNATSLISWEASGLVEANRVVNKEHASICIWCRPLAYGITRGDRTVSFPVQHLAFESQRPCTLGAWVLPWREGLTVMEGSHRCPFRLALAEGGWVSVPARPASEATTCKMRKEGPALWQELFRITSPPPRWPDPCLGLELSV